VAVQGRESAFSYSAPLQILDLADKHPWLAGCTNGGGNEQIS